jgi:hypothetical protein
LTRIPVRYNSIHVGIALKKLVVYTKTVPTSGLPGLLKNLEVVPVLSKEELIKKLVELTEVLGVLVEAKGIAGDFPFFLYTLKRSFPLLEIVAITDSGDGALPAGSIVLKGQPSPPQIAQACAQISSRAETRNIRTSHRFEWPLAGTLCIVQDCMETYPVRSLSSSGAFLECPGSTPTPGAKATLKIDFQNFSVLTDCEILDPRQASSNLPSGFGVRFSGLSEQAREIIDMMIRNALTNALLNPDTEPEIPSLGEEELLSIGPELR